MVQPSRAELLERIDELEAKNEELQEKLDAIADVLDKTDDDDGDD